MQRNGRIKGKTGRVCARRDARSISSNLRLHSACSGPCIPAALMMMWQRWARRRGATDERRTISEAGTTRPDPSLINSSSENKMEIKWKKLEGPRDKGMCCAPAGPENVYSRMSSNGMQPLLPVCWERWKFLLRRQNFCRGRKFGSWVRKGTRPGQDAELTSADVQAALPEPNGFHCRNC